MGRILRRLAVALVVLAGIGAIWVYDTITSLDALPVSEDVWMLRGLGGNVGVLRTSQGAVVVDTMTFRLQGDRIREKAEQLAGGPVQSIVNTHYHVDHAHGNPGFAPGTRVVSTERTLDYLMHFDAGYWEGSGARTLPNELFAEEHEMRIGGKTIRSYHPGRGHTAGDLVVLFVEDRVLHTGDLLFHGHWPNIDIEAGGSIEAWIGTLDRVLELDFDRVIPGHGDLTDREGILVFQGFLEELWEVGQTAAAEGLSLEKTLEVARLGSAGGITGIYYAPMNRDFVLRRAWEEATGAVRPEEVPRAERKDEE